LADHRSTAAAGGTHLAARGAGNSQTGKESRRKGFWLGDQPHQRGEGQPDTAAALLAPHATLELRARAREREREIERERGQGRKRTGALREGGSARMGAGDGESAASKDKGGGGGGAERASLDGVRDKNVMQLKKLNTALFPVRYNDKYYQDTIASKDFSKLGAPVHPSHPSPLHLALLCSLFDYSIHDWFPGVIGSTIRVPTYEHLRLD